MDMTPPQHTANPLFAPESRPGRHPKTEKRRRARCLRNFKRKPENVMGCHPTPTPGTPPPAPGEARAAVADTPEHRATRAPSRATGAGRQASGSRPGNTPGPGRRLEAESFLRRTGPSPSVTTHPRRLEASDTAGRDGRHAPGATGARGRGSAHPGGRGGLNPYRNGGRHRALSRADSAAKLSKRLSGAVAVNVKTRLWGGYQHTRGGRPR